MPIPEQLKGAFRNFHMNWGMMSNIALFFLGFILFAIILGVVLYFVLMNKQFKYKIIIFQKVGGKYIPVNRDSAKLMRISDAGDNVMFTRKTKKILPQPQIQVSPNTYWFAITSDGEWINFDLTDLDEERREMGAHFLDKEMRYARTELQQAFKNRYEKPSWLEKYGGMIAYTVLIMVTAIGFWLIISKIMAAIGASTKATEAAAEVLKNVKQVLSSLDALKSGGSGVIPAS